MGRTVEKEHEMLVKKYNRQENWRKGYYEGYQKGTLLEQYAWRDDFVRTVLDIEGDDKATISRKNAILRDITAKGGQKMEKYGTTRATKWVSERILSQADVLQSNINFENYLLYRAMLAINNEYKTKNINGDMEYRSRNLENNLYAVEIPVLPGLGQSRVFTIDKTGKTIGDTQYSKLFKKANVDVVDYESYIYNSMLSKQILSRDPRNLKNYGQTFKGRQWEGTPRWRIQELRRRLIKSMFGEGSYYKTFWYDEENKKHSKKHARDFTEYTSKEMKVAESVKRKMKYLNNADTLYIYIKYYETFNIDYIYSQADFLSLMNRIETYIDYLQQLKTGIKEKGGKNLTHEEKQLQGYYETVGTYYD